MDRACDADDNRAYNINVIYNVIKRMTHTGIKRKTHTVVELMTRTVIERIAYTVIKCMMVRKISQLGKTAQRLYRIPAKPRV